MSLIEIVLAALAVIAIGIAIASHAKAAPAAAAQPVQTVDHVGIINAAAGVVAAANGAPSAVPKQPILVAPPAEPAPAAVTFNPDNYPDPGARYQAWQAAGRPLKDAMGRELSVSGGLTAAPAGDGAQSSFGPLAAFTSEYQHGRWTFTKDAAGNVAPISVPIVAPHAGAFHFACSGSGGVPGGDNSVRLALTVTDAASGAIVGSGGDNPPYASFTATVAGQGFTLTIDPAGKTMEDITFAPGLG